MARRVEVHKFGGTSVAGPDRLRAAAALIAEAQASGEVVVVSSAMAGTTNRLVQICASAEGRAEAVGWIRDRHLEALAGLGLDDREAGASVRALLDELDALVRSLSYLHATPDAMHDRIQSIGERLAVELLAGALEARGMRAQPMSADAFLETSGAFREADPATFRADRRTAAAVRRVLDAGRTPVVTGFFGRGPDGDIRLLGRGGSDLSASLLASALDADRLVIWTDVEGVWSCDPGVVPEAQPVPHLHYHEAGEMAYFGSKVLHPRTMIPVVDKGIPVEVRSSLAPAGAFTRIDGSLGGRGESQVSVSVIRGVTLLSIEGAGMAGVAGVSARLFGALAAAGVSVVLISQSSSEASICFAVRDEDAGRASAAVRGAFRLDIARGFVEQVATRPNAAVVTAVGSGLAHRIGAAAAIMGACARAGANILAITQGSSELSVSVAVDAADARAAARGIHAAFRGGAGLSVALVGLGNVGRAVAQSLLAQTAHRLVAVMDSSGCLIEPRGLAAERLAAIAAHKRDGGRLASLEGAVAGASVLDLIERLARDGTPNLVVVDCTADVGMAAAARRALERGIDYVTANKPVVACDRETFAGLQEAAWHSGARLLCEATVGAGLPVARALEGLRGAGDAIVRLEAALSGSMAYVIGEVQRGVPLRDVVHRAIELGYAEPDPSDDLGGVDLARKALILARLAGLDRGVEAEVTPMVSLRAGEDLDAQLKAADPALRSFIEAAGQRGEEVRYLARIEGDGRMHIGLRALGAGHPMHGQSAARAAIAVWTRMNGEDRPLLISGAGAGAEATAGGVLADLARLGGAGGAHKGGVR